MVSTAVGLVLIQVSPVGLTLPWDHPRTCCTAPEWGFPANPILFEVRGRSRVCVCIVTPMGWCHPCQGGGSAGWWRSCGAARSCCAPAQPVSNSSRGSELVR